MAKIRAEAAQGCQEELVSLNSLLIDSLSDMAIAARLAGALLNTTWSMASETASSYREPELLLMENKESGPISPDATGARPIGRAGCRKAGPRYAEPA